MSLYSQKVSVSIDKYRRKANEGHGCSKIPTKNTIHLFNSFLANYNPKFG